MEKIATMPVRRNVQQGSFLLWLMSRQGISMTLIAQSFGCTPGIVNRVIWGTRKAKDVEAFIANVLGYPSWQELKRAEEVFNSFGSKFLRDLSA